MRLGATTGCAPRHTICSPMPAVLLDVNGTPRRLDAPADEPLLSALRNRLDLTGTKYGCGEGQCGACTVLLDGAAVRSCQTTLAEAAGKKIVTIEGLEQNGRLHPVQAAFLEVEALQCGYCTPGMIVSAAALLRSNPSPTTDDIVGAMSGNVCRCGTYPRILDAVRRAAKAGAKESPAR
jgi:aerobic-type carbon monoxide dehydrogenase small subunit (CoxS/CutS family)